MQSVNSKHGKHILQFLMTFIAQHYTTTVAIGRQWQSYTHADLLHTNTAPVVTPSTDDDTQPVSLMYTLSPHA